jgi:transcriptional regulator with XRE-family HTH domain
MRPMQNPTIGNALKNIRQYLRLDCTKMGALLGVSQGYYSCLEHNTKAPSVKMTANIAAKLNVPVTTLVYGNAMEVTQTSRKGTKQVQITLTEKGYHYNIENLSITEAANALATGTRLLQSNFLNIV